MTQARNQRHNPGCSHNNVHMHCSNRAASERYDNQRECNHCIVCFQFWSFDKPFQILIDWILRGCIRMRFSMSATAICLPHTIYIPRVTVVTHYNFMLCRTRECIGYPNYTGRGIVRVPNFQLPECTQYVMTYRICKDICQYKRVRRSLLGTCKLESGSGQLF